MSIFQWIYKYLNTKYPDITRHTNTHTKYKKRDNKWHYHNFQYFLGWELQESTFSYPEVFIISNHTHYLIQLYYKISLLLFTFY